MKLGETYVSMVNNHLMTYGLELDIIEVVEEDGLVSLESDTGIRAHQVEHEVGMSGLWLNDKVMR